MQENAIFNKKIKANASVVFTDLEDGSAVLLDLESKFYYSLNATGCFMWQVFEGKPASVEQLVGRIVKAYEVSEEDARRDIADFVGDLVKEGLVEVS